MGGGAGGEACSLQSWEPDMGLHARTPGSPRSRRQTLNQLSQPGAPSHDFKLCLKWTRVRAIGVKEAWASEAQKVRKTLRFGGGDP